jgi:hypothetical protein
MQEAQSPSLSPSQSGSRIGCSPEGYDFSGSKLSRNSRGQDPQSNLKGATRDARVAESKETKVTSPHVTATAGAAACQRGLLFHREWVNSSNTSLNRREQFLAADQPPSTKTKSYGPKKRAARTVGHKWAGYHPKSKSWYGDGISPEGKRWRKYGFETALEASAWAMGTRGRVDELSYAAATLPAAITRDVANAMNLWSKSGLNPYEEGLFAGLVRDDQARNPTGEKTTFANAVQGWLEAKRKCEGIKPRTVRDARDYISPAVAKLGEMLVYEIRLRDIEGVLSGYTRYRRRNIRVKIEQVFEYCQKHHLIGSAPGDNPCFGIEKPMITTSEPDPISTMDAIRLMALAVQTETTLGCTAWVAFRLFKGFRDSEAAKVNYPANRGNLIYGV